VQKRNVWSVGNLIIKVFNSGWLLARLLAHPIAAIENAAQARNGGTRNAQAAIKEMVRLPTPA
jgi:hypothetical protein